ncbi:mitochondrial pyruvate dehydrogenase kinase protein [Apiospora phragmitis]|uniref:Protein-serine/threonine kinase n=1 Tax=Apiospora phragmitis TaxID=2905665 RepID=A0ABR1X6V8_9PEZI
MKALYRPLGRLKTTKTTTTTVALSYLSQTVTSFYSTSANVSPPQKWSHPPSTAAVTDDEIVDLSNRHQHSLSLADLVKHGRPPLASEALFQSANFTLSLLPIRLARRIQALRNLPFIVVSNPNISKIYNNYLHSLSTLLPWKHRTIANLDAEIRFTSVLAELVTRFLDEHLRARIGTRLIAEQHIALHYSSAPHFDPASSPTPCPEHPSYIGVIDTALCPAQVVDSCANWVAELCELKYGVRPRWVIDGEPETQFAYVPMHLEYIITELLKNAFRATVETRRNREPVVITVAPEPPDAGPPRVTLRPPAEDMGAFRSEDIKPLDDNAPGVTIRIRDRGGGISPDVLPNVWSYSFTTFSDYDDVPGGGGGGGSEGGGMMGSDALNLISGRQWRGQLHRRPGYFGGGINVQSLHGWGTDVYLRLKGVGKIQ